MGPSTLVSRAYGIAFRLGVRITLALIASPFFVLYGLLAIIGAGRSAVLALQAMSRLSGPSVPCHHCGQANVLADRWRCGRCKAEYHGFVGCCPLCGATARAFACARCRITIPLGLD